MPLTLYGMEMSQPTRAIMMYLALLGETYDFKRIDLLKGEHKSEEFTKINPHQLIPAIQEDGLTLNESGAILIYIATTRKDNKFYSQDPKVAARINAYIMYHQTGIRPKTAPYFASVYKALFPPERPIPPKDVAQKALEESTQKFCDLFLKDSKFVAGDTLTIGDLLAASEYQQIIVGSNWDYKSKFPLLAEWFDRVMSEGAIKKTSEIVAGFHEKFKDIAQ